jgi:hypothetical protein
MTLHEVRAPTLVDGAQARVLHQRVGQVEVPRAVRHHDEVRVAERVLGGVAVEEARIGAGHAVQPRERIVPEPHEVLVEEPTAGLVVADASAHQEEHQLAAARGEVQEHARRAAVAAHHSVDGHVLPALLLGLAHREGLARHESLAPPRVGRSVLLAAPHE